MPWSTVSKANDKSRSACWPESIISVRSEQTLIRAVSVEWPFLYADWCRGKSSAVPRYDSSCCVTPKSQNVMCYVLFFFFWLNKVYVIARFIIQRLATSIFKSRPICICKKRFFTFFKFLNKKTRFWGWFYFSNVFSARQHVCHSSLSPVRPSVRLSVCLSVRHGKLSQQIEQILL